MLIGLSAMVLTKGGATVGGHHGVIGRGVQGGDFKSVLLLLPMGSCDFYLRCEGRCVLELHPDWKCGCGIFVPEFVCYVNPDTRLYYERGQRCLSY